ncbi:MAG: hypothetical protein IPK13_14260 [Deltaproteobacteria bacterium]|nr:hypothetical protein [Deltaproteobacteria bacterium]
MKPLLFILLLSVGATDPEQRVTIGSGARVRAQPNAQGKELIKLGVGTVVTKTEAKRVGDTEWLHVVADAPVKVDGWISAALTVVYSEAERDNIALSVARQRLAATSVWADDKDAVSFLGRAAAQAQSEAVRGELSLARLLIMHRLMEQRMSDGLSEEALSAWAKKTPGAFFDGIMESWMVPASEYWALHDKAKGTATAELIAYEAAKAPFPGECEISVSCSLSRVKEAEGRYLALYPKGAHSAEIQQRMITTLHSIKEISAFESESAESESAEVDALLKALTKMVAGLEPRAKKKVLAALAPLATTARKK